MKFRLFIQLAQGKIATFFQRSIYKVVNQTEARKHVKVNNEIAVTIWR